MPLNIDSSKNRNGGCVGEGDTSEEGRGGIVIKGKIEGSPISLVWCHGLANVGAGDAIIEDQLVWRKSSGYQDGKGKGKDEGEKGRGMHDEVGGWGAMERGGVGLLICCVDRFDDLSIYRSLRSPVPVKILTC